MLSHETPGPTSLWPFPAEAGMCPDLVHCACLQANASASYCQLNIETARPSSFSFFVSFFFFFYRALCGCCSRQHQYSQAKIPHRNLQVGSHRLKTFPLRLCAPFWPPKTFHPHPASSWRAMVILQSKAPVAYRPGHKAGNHLGVLERCHPSATHVAVLGDVPAMWETLGSTFGTHWVCSLSPHLASISDNTREFHSAHTHIYIL